MMNINRGGGSFCPMYGDSVLKLEIIFGQLPCFADLGLGGHKDPTGTLSSVWCHLVLV